MQGRIAEEQTPGRRLWSLGGGAGQTAEKWVRNPGSWLELLGLISAQSLLLPLKGTLMPASARASRDPSWMNFSSFLNPLLHVREKEDWLGRVWRGQGAGSVTAARQQRVSAPAPPTSGHKATAWFSVWLFHVLTAYFFLIVAPKLAGGKWGVFNKIPKLLTFANWNFEQVA